MGCLDSPIMNILILYTFFFQKSVQKVLKLCFYVATPTCSLSMPRCQVGGDPAEVTTPNVEWLKNIKKGKTYFHSIIL